MRSIDTALPEVRLIRPTVHADPRGFFVETWRSSESSRLALPTFVQDCQSRSKGGVVRGLHYQLGPPQAKLVRVVRGCIYDVAVDVRRGSPTFGLSVAAILDDVEHQQLYVPSGFAHGFMALSEEADVAYRCSAYYDPDSEQGIAWDDPDLAITWPEGMTVTLSPRDRLWPRLHLQDTHRLATDDRAAP